MRPILAAVAACALFLAPGCTKIAARDFIREGNTLYANGQYREAIEKYNEAEKLEPDLVTLFWNRACAAESIVLKIKDPNQLVDRKVFTDLALSDFKTWLDRAGNDVTEADREAYLNHRLALLDADERCDDLLSYFLEKHNQEPKEEGWYTRISKQYDSCGRSKDAEQWLVKRTVDFPTNPRAYLSLAIRKLEQLYPEPDSGLQYNGNLSEDERLALANEAIALLDKATMIDHKFVEAYIYRSIAYTQRQLARRYGDDPTQNTAYENLNMILAREDGMSAWRQQKAICDIKVEPECPTDKAPEGPCCMLAPRPISPEEEAADAERKKAIEEEIRLLESDSSEVESVKGKGKKGKGQGSK
ncbi:tetratricopeptide repeat protein [Nannocystis pusilla]|uniref:Tetratricopeptide repeat protein n=1 Tax=Nannocystis pusilla TaxID=889268 RepID=A0ABS7TQ22_9BACT|nr:tetratricopeptide repeat protein [Nannocystis pusilla]MBZ5710318.1 tetratricopeptide repeat protein [Nannocystis pusilla]